MTSECHIPEGYKKTEVGVVPEEWKIVELKEHAEQFIVPMRDKPKTFDGRVPWCRIEDFNGKYLYTSKSSRFVSDEVISSMNLRINPIGTVLCSCSAKLGICAIVGQPLITNQTFIGIVPKKTLDTEFLYYLMGSYAHRLQMLSTGTTIAYLPRENFERFLIVRPPLPEQHKIASILSKVDEHISHTEAIIEKTEELKKGLMQQLLTKGIGHTKFKTFEFKGVKMQIPVEWDISSIEAHLIDYKSGAPLSPNDFSDSGCIVFPKKAVVRGGVFKIDSCEQTYAKDDFAQIYSKSIVNRSYLITTLRDLVPTGPNIGLIVKITDDKEYLLAQGVYGFRLNASLSEKFLIQLSNSQFYRQIMNKIMVGSTQVHIRNSDFFNVKIPLPPLSEQQKIASILSKIDDHISQNQTYLSHLQELKKGLMQDLLTGKVRVGIGTNH